MLHHHVSTASQNGQTKSATMFSHVYGHHSGGWGEGYSLVAILQPHQMLNPTQWTFKMTQSTAWLNTGKNSLCLAALVFMSLTDISIDVQRGEQSLGLNTVHKGMGLFYIGMAQCCFWWLAVGVFSVSSLINVTEPCQYLEDPPSHRERIPIFTSPQHIDRYGLLFKLTLIQQQQPPH